MDFNNFQEKCQVAGSSQVLVKKIVIEGEIGGKRWKFALASGEEANNREKVRGVYYWEKIYFQLILLCLNFFNGLVSDLFVLDAKCT